MSVNNLHLDNEKLLTKQEIESLERKILEDEGTHKNVQVVIDEAATIPEKVFEEMTKKFDREGMRAKLIDVYNMSEEDADKELDKLEKDMSGLVPEKELPPCHIYKIEVVALENTITINNKDFSYAKAIKLTPQAKSVFGGRTKFFAKCRIFPSGEFRIVKFLDGKKAF